VVSCHVIQKTAPPLCAIRSNDRSQITLTRCNGRIESWETFGRRIIPGSQLQCLLMTNLLQPRQT